MEKLGLGWDRMRLNWRAFVELLFERFRFRAEKMGKMMMRIIRRRNNGHGEIDDEVI